MVASRRPLLRRPSPQRKLVLGPPGTGKTTWALAALERAASAYGDDRIALLTFTRRAAAEATERLGARADALPYVRTLHSLCYRLLGLRDTDVLGPADYTAIGDTLGLRFSRFTGPEDGGLGGRTEGDTLRSIVDYALATERDPESVLADGLVGEDVDVWRLRRYVDTLRAYKTDTGKLDFNDMLLRARERLEPLPVQMALIDEAQDLSPLQWSVVHRLLGRAREIIVVGDDDQAIYEWAGADPEALVRDYDGPATQVLSQSHRVPVTVHAVATGLMARCEHRRAKEYAPRPVEGDVQRVGDAQSVPFGREGTYLLLARNGYLLRTWVEACRAAGLPYTLRGKPGASPQHLRAIRAWEAARRGVPVAPRDQQLYQQLAADHHLAALARGEPVPVWYEALTGIDHDDATYYRAALRRGHDLDVEPRHRISTIHGAKGAEADHVALLTDQAVRTSHAAEVRPDAETRVWYVATTRARQTLTIVAAGGLHRFEI